MWPRVTAVLRLLIGCTPLLTTCSHPYSKKLVAKRVSKSTRIPNLLLLYWHWTFMSNWLYIILTCGISYFVLPESNVGIAIIFGTAFGLFTIMMIIIIASIACRRNQRTNQNIFPMGHLTQYLSFCGRGREKHVPSKSAASSTRDRAYSQSTVVPNFTCIENTDSQQAPQDTNPAASEGQSLLRAGSTEGAAESISALTDAESRSMDSDVKNNDSSVIKLDLQ